MAEDETRGLFSFDPGWCLHLIDDSFFPPSFRHDGEPVINDLRKLECVSTGSLMGRCQGRVGKRLTLEVSRDQRHLSRLMELDWHLISSHLT